MRKLSLLLILLPFTSKFNMLRLLAVCLLVMPAMAQNSGSISGTVVDSSGAVVSGATVQAIDQAKGTVTIQTQSGIDGIFVLSPLQSSVYSVLVQAKGMKELRKTNIHLDPYQKVDIGQAQLAVGGTTELVTVEAQAPLVDTATADHSSVIDSKQVTETLLNGRDFQSLMKTLPGVTSNNQTDFQLQFNNTDQMHVNGLRGSDNNVFLDGAVNTDVGANDGQYTQLSMDAVGEFKVQTSNFAAEYGRNPGIFIAINTKSGGSHYHGTLYEFNREDGFGAVPFGQTTTGFLRFNQYGGNIGGPIPMPHAKNKMFFFFNYEGTRGLRPGNSQFNSTSISGLGKGYTLPNPAILTGDFTSQYTGGDICDHLAGPTGPCTDTGFLNGQIFQPGTITHDSVGEVSGGTPICGTKAAPCNIIPASMLDANAPAWVKYWTPAYRGTAIRDPLTPSAGPGAGQFQKFFVPFNETYTLFKHQEVIRYDWNINQKTNFFFRWVDDSQTENYHNLFDFADYPILPEFRKKPGSSWSWNLVNVISPTLTNEFIFSYNHLTQAVDIAPGTAKSSYDFNSLGFTFAQLYPNANVDNRAPVLNDCCNGTFTGGSFHPGWHSEARQFTWTDNVTKVWGLHTFKTGVFFDYNQAGQQPVWDDTTFLKFGTGSNNPNDSNNYVANVLLGNFTQAQQTNGQFFGAFRFHQVEAFGQDSWKVSRKLTLEYGLRWGYMGPTYTVQPFFQNYWQPNLYNPAQAVTLNTTPGNYFGDICSAALAALPGGNSCIGLANYGNPFNGIVQEGHGIPPGAQKHRYDNFGPRFGFSYDPFGDGKTAIRAGGGVFYERIRQNNNSFDGLGNPPLSYTATVFNGKLSQLGPQDITGVLAPSSVNAFDPQGQIPTIYGYSAGVQRELPGQTALEVAYVGNMGRHLMYQYNSNSLPVGCNPLFDASNSCSPSKPNAFYVPFAGYGTTNFTKYDANSEYNSLQVKLTRRFHRDLLLTADYVLSKALDIEDNDNGNINDTNGGGNNLTDPLHPQLDWARAGYNRTHVFNLNYVYTFPTFRNSSPAMRLLAGGWEWGGIWKYWTGPPLDVTSNGNAGNFIGVTRPDLGSGNPYLGHSDNIHWLNPAVMIEPAAGTVGNIKRNAFNGPGINNWDMSLFKNFNFTESKYLQLRLETYNTFNHTQPAGINLGFTSPSAGTPPSAGTVGSSGDVANYRDARNVQLGAKFYF
jgi:Carboxypeptidase regulatory-like domain/TonB-dependent Receptor Plug Domain